MFKHVMTYCQFLLISVWFCMCRQKLIRCFEAYSKFVFVDKFKIELLDKPLNKPTKIFLNFLSSPF